MLWVICLVQLYSATVADSGGLSAILRLPIMVKRPTIHSIVATTSFTLVHQLIGCGVATMTVSLAVWVLRLCLLWSVVLVTFLSASAVPFWVRVLNPPSVVGCRCRSDCHGVLIGSA